MRVRAVRGDRDSKTRRGDARVPVAVGAVLALLALALYVATLGPTILPYRLPTLPDTTMLQMQVCVLGITHPTGYPTYLMLSHLVTYLPFGDCGYRANLASAIYGSLAVAAVFAAALLLCRRVLAASVGALAFALGTTFWSQAVVAEVYTLNALLVALVLIALLAWRERRQDRYLLLAAFGMGLCVTNHMTSALVLPAGVLFVLIVDRTRLTDARLVLASSGLFALGLLPYLYLPVRAIMDAPMQANDPETLGRFLYVVSGGNLRGGFFAFGPSELPARIELYARYALENFGLVLLALAAVGLVAMLARDKAGAALTGFLFVGWLFHAIENNIVDVNLYFIPTYLILALWVSRGAAMLLEEAGALPTRIRTPALFLLCVLLLLSPLWNVRSAYVQNDYSDDYRARATIDTVAQGAAPNATVLHHRSPLWYMVLVEKRRRDLTLVDPFFHNRKTENADIVWPEEDTRLATADRRYGTDDPTGVKAAEIAAEKGPVYLLAQQDVSPEPFREAGFEAVRVKGELYRLVPPGE